MTDRPDDLIREAKKLASAASPSPWVIEWDSHSGSYDQPTAEDCEWPWRIPNVCNFAEEEGTEADAAFIASARLLVPALADALEAAQKEIESWQATCEVLEDGTGSTLLAEEIRELEARVSKLTWELEATQEERDDEWLSPERALYLWTRIESAEARVRQLEEVLRKIADRDYVTRERGDPIPATIDGRAGSIIYVEGLAPWQIAREVLAAKENTTP